MYAGEVGYAIERSVSKAVETTSIIQRKRIGLLPALMVCIFIHFNFSKTKSLVKKNISSSPVCGLISPHRWDMAGARLGKII
jgi:hypothetical protein